MAGYNTIIGRDGYEDDLDARLGSNEIHQFATDAEQARLMAVDDFNTWRWDLTVIEESVEVWPIEQAIGEELVTIGWDVRAETEPLVFDKDILG